MPYICLVIGSRLILNTGERKVNSNSPVIVKRGRRVGNIVRSSAMEPHPVLVLVLVVLSFSSGE